MMKYLLFLSAFLFGICALATDVQCPNDGQGVLAKFVQIQEKMHANFYKSSITVYQDFYKKDGNAKKDESTDGFTLNRDFESGGVTYPVESFKADPKKGIEYGSLLTLGKDQQRIVDEMISTDKDVNDLGKNKDGNPKWTDIAVTTANYNIPAPVCEIDPGTKKIKYKFTLVPKNHIKGLFDGQLVTDENGVPLLMDGQPHDKKLGLQVIHITQTFEQDPQTKAVYPHQLTIHTQTGPIHITVGDTTVNFNNGLTGASGSGNGSGSGDSTGQP